MKRTGLVSLALLALLNCSPGEAISFPGLDQERFRIDDVQVLTGRVDLSVNPTRSGNDLILLVALTNGTRKTQMVPPILSERLYFDTRSRSGKIDGFPILVRGLVVNLEKEELVRLEPGNTLSGRVVSKGFFKVPTNLVAIRAEIAEYIDDETEFAAISPFVKLPEPPVVPDSRYASLSLGQMERKLGKGEVTVGGHSNSGRVWSPKKSWLYADGFNFGPDVTYLVDCLWIENWKGSLATNYPFDMLPDVHEMTHFTVGSPLTTASSCLGMSWKSVRSPELKGNQVRYERTEKKAVLTLTLTASKGKLTKCILWIDRPQKSQRE